MWIIIFTFAMNVSIVFSSLSKNQTIKTAEFNLQMQQNSD